MYLTLLLSLLVACTGYLVCSAQPICRDLLAPFPYGEASYCPEYGGFGCCGKREERRASKWAADAQLRLITDEEKAFCSEYTRNVSCLTCSPLAGRIFDDRDGASSERIPLCRPYCEEMYIECRFSLLRLFKLHPWREGLVSKFPSDPDTLQGDAERFCERYASESPHCYPTVTSLERQFTTPPPAEETDCVCLVPVVTGLNSPLAAASPRDKSRRLFILVSTNIVIYDTRERFLLNRPFLNMTEVIKRSPESGAAIQQMMNFVFHPDFARNGRLYVFYTVSLNSSNGVGTFSVNLSEFRVSLENRNQVDYNSRRLLLSAVFEKQDPAFHLHGGGLFFKDRLLHVAIGRTPESEDIFNLGIYHGKFIRINVDLRDHGKEYAVPDDNPFVNDPSALPEIYAYGFAQPWKCSVDRGDPGTREGAGRIFCGDIGIADAYEEVNLVVKGGNYGYPIFEGDKCLTDNQTCSAALPGVTLPAYAYQYSSVPGVPGRDTSVIGGYVYRGCLHPNLNGIYLYAHFVGGIRALNETNGRFRSRHVCVGNSEVCPGTSLENAPVRYTSFAQDEGGELYLLGYAGETQGSVYRITDPARRSDPQRCKKSLKFSHVAGPQNG